MFTYKLVLSLTNSRFDDIAEVDVQSTLYIAFGHIVGL
jgi:hypothetical protein